MPRPDPAWFLARLPWFAAGLGALVTLGALFAGWQAWQAREVRRAVALADAALARHTWAGDALARAHLEEALDRAPGSHEALDLAAFLAARTAFETPGSVEARAEAEALLTGAERLESDLPGALAGRALMDLEDGRPGAAALRLARGLDLWPADPRLGLAMALTERRLERPDLARARLTALVTDHPDYLPATAALGAVLRQGGGRKAAARLYRTTALRAPAYLPALSGWLGTVQGRTGASEVLAHLTGPGSAALEEASPEAACATLAEARGLAPPGDPALAALGDRARALGCAFE